MITSKTIANKMIWMILISKLYFINLIEKEKSKN